MLVKWNYKILETIDWLGVFLFLFSFSYTSGSVFVSFSFILHFILISTEAAKGNKQSVKDTIYCFFNLYGTSKA